LGEGGLRLALGWALAGRRWFAGQQLGRKDEAGFQRSLKSESVTETSAVADALWSRGVMTYCGHCGGYGESGGFLNGVWDRGRRRNGVFGLLRLPEAKR